MSGYYNEERLFKDAARELLDKDLCGRIRLYRMSSGGLKLRVLWDISVHRFREIEREQGGIEMCVLDGFGSGYYCAKLFSTKYGRNILERRYDFGVGKPEDIVDF